MIVEFDNKILFEVTDLEKKVIQNDIPEKIFEKDMMRRFNFWLTHPCQLLADKSHKSIVNSLKERGKTSIPTGKLTTAAMWHDEYPTQYGDTGLKDHLCKVGDLSFTLSKDYQKIWRKILERDWEKHFGIKFEDEQEISFLEKEKLVYENRIVFVINHKHEKCFERLQNHWITLLEERGIEEIPIDESEFAQLVFSQPDYMSRSQKDLNEDDLN